MIDTILHPRVIQDKDWATVLFLIAFAIIAFTKSVYETRFGEFIKLIYSDKFIKVYKDNGNLRGSFTISLFLVQVISISFFIQLSLNYFGYASKTDWMLFIRIVTLVMFFILSKYLLEKIIADSFAIDEIVEQYNLQKVTYRTYIGLLILPIDVILFYYNSISSSFLTLLIYMILIINVIVYFILIKNNQKLIISKIFYFILYLCAFEIAPYYFMYYWFTKNGV